MASEYQQTTEKEIQDRVRSKYGTTIAELKALHFEEMCFVEESLPALGTSNGFLGLFGVLAALPFEVARIGRNLRASIFSILMVSRECDTYVAPFGLGLKFYTGFTDGTCVITGNFNSQSINDDREKLYKSAQNCSIAEAWQQHQDKVNAFAAGGKQRKYQLSFDECARLMRKEDEYMLKSIPFASAGSVDFGSMFLSAIMFGCLLIAALLIFSALPILVHTLYPACVFVKDLGQFSLPRSFLIVPVCVAFSWLLARVQKNTFTIDAIGTELHGQIASPDGRGYLATKWLVFLSMPILPVRSYQIDGEYSKSFHPNFDSMHPLPELLWEQIWETIWRFKWGYLLALAFWFGVGVWALSQCR